MVVFYLLGLVYGGRLSYLVFGGILSKLVNGSGPSLMVSIWWFPISWGWCIMVFSLVSGV